MNVKIKNTLKKTVKIAGITCIALGGAALITSGAALKALTEGAKYLKDTVKKIAHEESEAEQIAVEAVAEDSSAAEASEEDTAAAAENT